MTTRNPKPSALCRAEPPPLSEKLAWSLAEAAATTGLCVRTLQAAISRGELSAIRVGRRVLLAPASVSAWLASKQGA